VRLRAAIEKISEWLSRAVDEGRAALTALRSTTNTENLTDRLREAAEECSRSSDMTLRFAVNGKQVSLSAFAIEQIFHIGYEAMRNACVHSQATVLEVDLSYGEEVILRIKDNGIGITSGYEDDQRSGHYGLPGMRERAECLEGALKIESTPETGTEVTLVAKVKTDPLDL
jgi:signal transduction histidine kinase